jgi:hypothetical protein
MLVIGEAVVDDPVARASFCCDFSRCYGACCTIPGARGAPLSDDEVAEIQKAYPAAKVYLSERSIHAIEQSGLIEGPPGNFATSCVDDRECVFVYFEERIARCALERAYLEGKSSWRKPMSCHLFPVRIRDGSTNGIHGEILRYEQIEECQAGRERGEHDQVALHEFLREPLIRKYGMKWYNELLEFCRTKTF